MSGIQGVLDVLRAEGLVWRDPGHITPLESVREGRSLARVSRSQARYALAEYLSSCQQEGVPAVSRAEDLAEIQQTAALYAHVIDRKEWSRLNEIYAADGVYDTSAFGLGVHEGLPAITEFLSGRELSIHHGTNVFVESWDEASNRAYGYSKFLSVTKSGSVHSGQYIDEWVRTAEGWRFQRRASSVLAPADFTVRNPTH
jgi:hypothetical protein